MTLFEHRSPDTESGNTRDWSPKRRLLFRFVFSYLVVYTLLFPAPLHFIEFARKALGFIVGRILFHHALRVEDGGDSPLSFFLVVCCVVVALLAMIVWTQLDRKHTQYDRLHDWLRVYIRFVLASTMIVYG